MSIHRTMERLTARPRRFQVSWVTIALFAIVFAYVDGFWVTSMQGAVGAFEPVSRYSRAGGMTRRSCWRCTSWPCRPQCCGRVVVSGRARASW
jgi:hypothetical protein